MLAIRENKILAKNPNLQYCDETMKRTLSSRSAAVGFVTGKDSNLMDSCCEFCHRYVSGNDPEMKMLGHIIIKNIAIISGGRDIYININMYIINFK